MQQLAKYVLGLGVIAFLAAPALAQPPGGGRGFGGFGGMRGGLISNKSVQKELKLTDEQVKKAEEAIKAVNDKHPFNRQELESLSDEERRAKFQERAKVVGEETNKALTSILQPEQLKRYHQIQLQQRGVQAFEDSEVQKKLALTDDQKDKIKTIAEDLRKEMREIFQPGGGGNRQEAFQKMRTLSKEALENTAAVLNDTQKKTWKEMTGEPFEIKFDGPPGGGPGGQRRQQRQQ